MADKDNLIKLNFEHLKNAIDDEHFPNSQYVYVSKDFAVVRCFQHVLNVFLRLGQPYRLGELRIGRIISGTMKVTINLLNYEFHEGMLIYVSGESIVQPNYFSPGFNMEAISISDELVQILYKGMVPQCFLSGADANVLTMTETEAGLFHEMIQSLWVSIHDKSISKKVSQSLLTASLNLYEGIQARNISETRTSSSHEQGIFLQFLKYVQQYSKKERMLGFYADKMCISKHYLSNIIHEASGSTAKDWIERSVISEAKVMLKYSNLQTYQVSDQLNFSNPSFFCKFFKRLTGMTPQQYQHD